MDLTALEEVLTLETLSDAIDRILAGPDGGSRCSAPVAREQLRPVRFIG